MGRFVKSDIVDKVLLRDLPSLYGIRDVQELNRFFTYLAYNTGMELTFENTHCLIFADFGNGFRNGKYGGNCNSFPVDAPRKS